MAWNGLDRGLPLAGQLAPVTKRGSHRSLRMASSWIHLIYQLPTGWARRTVQQHYGTV